MTESKSQVPHFYVSYEYQADALVAVREQVNQYLDEGAKISVNDFVVKATALCLREFPNLNATYQGDHVLRHGDINVGVAVAVEGGLLTVVCKNADSKALPQISQEIREMAARVRSGKVRSDDIEGSTFSVSNLGMFGVESFSAIINPPEAAILAVGAARQVPVVDGGSIRAGWRMKATIAVDHRVSDGAEAARFMKQLSTYIEAPAGLLL
jgi:pyruvate dehydrogenase E2 component (dihydrolipoamide acetyltransferase)